MQIIALFLLLSFNLSAATLGLLDSGADPDIHSLSKHLNQNKVERSGRKNFDDDKNGYIDDIEGWNFIEESPRPFNHSLTGQFEDLFYKYYRVRERKALELWSPKEKAWYEAIRKDEEFLERLKKFRSYIHGSHVVGIAMKRTHQKYGPLNFINVKYLGKAEKGQAKEPVYSPKKKGSFNSRLLHLKKFITRYNIWQEGKLARAIDYVCQKAHVVNGSWGKSFKSSLKVVAQWYELEFDAKPKEAVNQELAKLFLSNLIVRTEKIAAKYPHILFVFSAGNTKSDNDVFPHYPSDARRSNIIAVGASRGNERTSSSNFGKKTVDLYAPGFLIESMTPDNKKLKTSGTSQAAPHISHAALVIRNINSKLKAEQIKKILMRTVDKAEAFISASGGQLNLERALQAAKLSKEFSLEESLLKAAKSIPAKAYDKQSKSLDSGSDPLPEPF